ncbi:MAG: sigma-70 family RNA polymerase sigma factor [Myxococcota bacterium]
MERLVASSLRHVHAIAKRYRRYRVPLDDLISEGHVGLMLAIERFDTERGIRLGTYASHWIRACILDFVVRSQTMIGAGCGAFRTKVFFALRRERAKLLEAGKDEQEVLEALSERFQLPHERMKELLMQLDQATLSLSTPTGEDMTLEDRMATGDASPDEVVALEDLRARLRIIVGDALGDLNDRERSILQQRLMSDDRPSLAELGDVYGISRERVRQIEHGAREKLRRRLVGRPEVAAA